MSGIREDLIDLLAVLGESDYDFIADEILANYELTPKRTS